jgi:hypothetical protein
MPGIEMTPESSPTGRFRNRPLVMLMQRDSHESAFPRRRLVKRCTTRFRGNAMDVVASDVTNVRCPACGRTGRSRSDGDALTIALSEDMPPARQELVHTTSEVIRELVAA